MSAVSELSSSQRAHAVGIITAVRLRDWPKKAAVIAVETALVESGLRILANGNVPDSLNHPHDLLDWSPDGLGHDHASVGMFQQQTGLAWSNPGTTTMTSADGWGRPADLMDAEKSTALFLDALSHVDWRNMPNWEAAQAVQHSIFSDGANYRAQDARATSIVNALWEEADMPMSDEEFARRFDARMQHKWLPFITTRIRNAMRARTFGGNFGVWTTKDAWNAKHKRTILTRKGK
jgi:hypothetical protein